MENCKLLTLNFTLTTVQCTLPTVQMSTCLLYVVSTIAGYRGQVPYKFEMKSSKCPEQTNNEPQVPLVGSFQIVTHTGSQGSALNKLNGKSLNFCTRHKRCPNLTLRTVQGWLTFLTWWARLINGTFW